MASDDKELSFEEGLTKLEGIVERLGAGDSSLEKSLELFEQGMRLSRACRKQLEAAESKVEILMKEGGTVNPQPFDLEERGG